MIQRDKGFYDLIAFGLGNGSFQEFVDYFFTNKYNAPQTDGFQWDSQIQIDFTYEQLQTELGIATLPTYVDIDSPAPYKVQDGATIGKNKIPRFKHGFAINEKIIREQMILVQRMGQAALTPATQKAMNSLLFDSVDMLLAGNRNALTYQRMQVVSTGQYSITTDNNPGGISGLTFDFGIPTKNKEVLTGNDLWWTTSTHTTANEGTASDPIKFLKDKRKAMTKSGFPAGHFEISSNLWDDMLSHSKVRERAGYQLQPLAGTSALAMQVGYNLDDTQMRAVIERLIGAPIMVRDTMAMVEKLDKTTKQVKKVSIPGFDECNISFVPNGQIGTIKAVEPLVVPDPAARLAWYDGGRTIIKQTFNTDTNTQYISSECTALAVPSAANYMCIYTVTK